MHPQTTTIPLTQGKVALVDAEDAPRLLVYKWQLGRSKYTCYARTGVRGSDGHVHEIKMHRLVMNAPEGVWIDHISGDGLDNRKANLRPCTPRQNAWNSRMRRNNTSGYRGIWAMGAVWAAGIGPQYLGCYPTAEEAARAYDTAARARYGAFAQLNFPDETTAVEPRVGLPRPVGRSGYHGVNGGWKARITYQGKRLHLGTYATAEEAARVVDAKARELFGSAALLNFPDA